MPIEQRVLIDEPTTRFCAVTMRLTILLLLSALSLGVAHAGDRPTKPAEPAFKRLRYLSVTDPKYLVRVTETIEAKDFSRGVGKFLYGEEYSVGVGDYAVEYRVFADGREWFLLPLTKKVAGQFASSTIVVSGVNRCPAFFTDYFAVDRTARRIEPYTFEVHKSCAKGFTEHLGKWDKPLNVIAVGKLNLLGPADLAIEEKVRMMDAEDRLRFHLETEAELAPTKRRIGTKLCKKQRNIIFIGYTESVSPDQDRIQVRISAAVYDIPSRPQLADFREQILWEDPILWQLCE